MAEEAVFSTSTLQGTSGKNEAIYALATSVTKSGSNYCFTCSLCPNKICTNFSRFVTHLERDHANLPEVKAALDVKKVRRSIRSVSTEGEEEHTFAPEEVPMDKLTALFFAIASFIVFFNLPVLTIASPMFHAVIYAAMALQKAIDSGEAVPLEFPSASTFRRWMDRTFFPHHDANLDEIHREEGRQWSAVLEFDGKKSASRQSREVCVGNTPAGFFTLCSDFPKLGVRKNQEWYFNFFSSIITGNYWIAPFVIAGITDGARASVVGMNQVASTFHILAIVCQLHCLNRTILHIFTKVECLKWAYSMAVKVVTLFNNIGWCDDMLKLESGGKSVWRFIPTRMLTIVICFCRLTRLMPYLIVSRTFNTFFKTLLTCLF
jgi:hypothetical protein